MFFASSTCLAIVVLDALWFNLRAMVPLVLVAAMIIVAYRGYTRLTLRFASLQRLYDFSRALGTTNLEPVIDERRGPAPGLHGDAGTPSPAGAGRAVRHPAPNLLGRPRPLGRGAH